MRTFSKMLIAVLIISALLPLWVTVSLLFYQQGAIAALQISELTPDIEKIFLISGAYMLSFLLLFAVAAWWIARDNKAGLSLAFVLGVITLVRGIFLFTAFNKHGFEATILASVGTIDGILILIFSFLAKPRTEDIR